VPNPTGVGVPEEDPLEEGDTPEFHVDFLAEDDQAH
jgi:segregation and condensation protein B